MQDQIERPGFKKHAEASVLPLIFAITLPAFLATSGNGIAAQLPSWAAGIFQTHFGWGLPWYIAWLPTTVGLAVMMFSMIPFMLSVREFHMAGGTLLPKEGHYPQRLVTTGPYAYTRNPMISGIFGWQLGVAIIFASWALLIFFLAFVIAQVIFTSKVEAAGHLVENYGEPAQRYLESTPAWFPRLKRN